MVYFIRKIVVISLAITVLFMVVYIFWPREASFELVTVKNGSISQEVIVTGKIKSSESAELAFEKSGKVRKVLTAIGDMVSATQILAELDATELNADLRQAEAAVAAQKAKLDELKRGSRPEEIRIQEVKSANAKISLEDTRQNLIDKLRDAFTKSDDAVRNLMDQLFNNPRSSNPQIAIIGFYEKTVVESARFTIENILNDWAELSYKIAGSKNPQEFIAKTKDNLNELVRFANLMALGVNNLVAGGSLSQTAVDGYKSDISTARVNLNTAISNISAAEEKLRTAESNLLLAENELKLKLAGAAKEEIDAQAAQLQEVEARVFGIKAQLEKNFLRSPINGVLIRQDAKPGEIVSAHSVIASVISIKNLEIEVFIPEVDIGKVSVGHLAGITIDAFPGESFSGEVAYIEPGETIIDGVVNFKVFINFNAEDPRLKSGLTANISIETMRKNGVLILPQFAILEKDEGSFVRRINGEEIIEIPVQTGIRSKDGMVEITSGVAEGESVVNVGMRGEK